MDAFRVALAGALVLLSCNGDRAPQSAPAASAAAAPEKRVLQSVVVRAEDRGEICSDIGPIRACWGGECGHAGCVVVRSLPEPAAISPLGWRCTGTGPDRRCFERGARAGHFECRGDTCVQPHPRLPDDGEWLCADSAGAVVCAGGEPAAGVASARADAGWHCGTRSGARGVADGGRRAQPSAAAAPLAGPRVCLDLDPDFPDGAASRWRCRYAYESGVQRICKRDAGANIADACNPSRPCVDGSRCNAGHCIVARPAPDCWIDSDCRDGGCRFGSCGAGEP